MTVRLKKSGHVSRMLWLTCIFFSFCLMQVNAAQTCNMPSVPEYHAVSSCAVTESDAHPTTSKACGIMQQCCNSFCVSSCLPVHVNLALIPLAKPYYAMQFSVVIGVDPAPQLRPPLFA